MHNDSATPNASAIHPSPNFLAAAEAHGAKDVSLCYQCRKCTNGCPAAFAMDVMPNQVMRMVQLGLEDEVLRSQTIWICAGCQTCTTRCPNDIDIAHLMDTLRQMSREAGVPAGEPNVVKFHKAFLDSIRRHGRIYELEMMAFYKLAAMDFFSDKKLAFDMLKKGKLKFLPSGIKGKQEVRRMFKKD